MARSGAGSCGGSGITGGVRDRLRSRYAKKYGKPTAAEAALKSGGAGGAVKADVGFTGGVGSGGDNGSTHQQEILASLLTPEAQDVAARFRDGNVTADDYKSGRIVLMSDGSHGRVFADGVVRTAVSIAAGSNEYAIVSDECAIPNSVRHRVSREVRRMFAGAIGDGAREEVARLDGVLAELGGGDEAGGDGDTDRDKERLYNQARRAALLGVVGYSDQVLADDDKCTTNCLFGLSRERYFLGKRDAAASFFAASDAARMRGAARASGDAGDPCENGVLSLKPEHGYFKIPMTYEGGAYEHMVSGALSMDFPEKIHANTDWIMEWVAEIRAALADLERRGKGRFVVTDSIPLFGRAETDAEGLTKELEARGDLDGSGPICLVCFPSEIVDLWNFLEWWQIHLLVNDHQRSGGVFRDGTEFTGVFDSMSQRIRGALRLGEGGERAPGLERLAAKHISERLLRVQKSAKVEEAFLAERVVAEVAGTEAETEADVLSGMSGISVRDEEDSGAVDGDGGLVVVDSAEAVPDNVTTATTAKKTSSLGVVSSVTEGGVEVKHVKESRSYFHGVSPFTASCQYPVHMKMFVRPIGRDFVSFPISGFVRRTSELSGEEAECGVKWLEWLLDYGWDEGWGFV